MKAQLMLVAQLEETLNDIWSLLDYTIEKTNWMGGK